MKFRKKPVIIEATQWFKNGDHPKDGCYYIDDKSPYRYLSEGKVVRYYRHPEIPGQTHCNYCETTMHLHGWIDTLEGGHIVCPGDWVITGIAGEMYPCKPDIFEQTYEPVEITLPVNFTTSWEGFGLLWIWLQEHERWEEFLVRHGYSWNYKQRLIDVNLISPPTLSKAVMEFFND